VYVVNPVPPEEVFKVPARVIAPVVDVLGVKPPKEVWNEVTGLDAPLEASSFTVPESL
jgi:hypothetical protein